MFLVMEFLHLWASPSLSHTYVLYICSFDILAWYNLVFIKLTKKSSSLTEVIRYKFFISNTHVYTRIRQRNVKKKLMTDLMEWFTVSAKLLFFVACSALSLLILIKSESIAAPGVSLVTLFQPWLCALLWWVTFTSKRKRFKIFVWLDFCWNFGNFFFNFQNCCLTVEPFIEYCAVLFLWFVCFDNNMEKQNSYYFWNNCEFECAFNALNWKELEIIEIKQILSRSPKNLQLITQCEMKLSL